MLGWKRLLILGTLHGPYRSSAPNSFNVPGAFQTTLKGLTPSQPLGEYRDTPEIATLSTTGSDGCASPRSSLQIAAAPRTC
jgi:hypothetical protein